MGKIFGISDNPVSTIESVLRPFELKPPKCDYIKTPKTFEKDTFVSLEKESKSNSIIKMRNGFGKLMSHLSGSKPKKNV